MSTCGVNQPIGSNAGERNRSRGTADRVRRLVNGCGIGERAGGRRTPRATPAALRGQHPQGEQGDKDHQGDRGTVTVERDRSLWGRISQSSPRFSCPLFAWYRDVNTTSAGAVRRSDIEV
jgi:hypothetical protein